MITDILFDFFGTLVRYVPGAFHTAPYERTHRFLQEQGFDIPYDTFAALFTAASDVLEADARQTFREYHMDDVGRAFFRDAFAIEVADPVLKPFIAHFIDEWSRGSVHFDQINAFLQQLTPRYRLSVISNTHYPALIHNNLAAMGCAGYFAQIVTSVEVGMRKPHPLIFHQTLAALQIAPANALYVGDTYIDDYGGATAAGIRCVLIDPQGRYEDVPDRIAGLFDLIPYCASLNE